MTSRMKVPMLSREDLADVIRYNHADWEARERRYLHTMTVAITAFAGYALLLLLVVVA